MLDIGDIYRQELPGLAIRGERLLDVSNICGQELPGLVIRGENIGGSC